jgi:hypothetical protein
MTDTVQFTETLNKYSGFVSLKAFDPPLNGIDDDAPALIAAMNSFPSTLDGNGASYAGTILVPFSKLRLKQTVHLTRQVRITGCGHPMGNSIGCSQIWVDDGLTGFVFDEGSDGASLQNLHIERGTNASGTIGHGIKMNFRGEIRNCTVAGFREHGIYIFGNAGGTPSTNTNNWRIDTVRSMRNSNCGLYVDGPDSNAGVAVGLDCSSNDIGIFDSSFLGNTYVGCHTASNRVGYKTDNANAANMFIGCYSENGETHELEVPAQVIGGTLAWYQFNLGTNISWFDGRLASPIVTQTTDKRAELALGPAYGVGNMVFGLKDYDETSGAYPFRLKHVTGGFILDHSNDQTALFAIWNENHERGRGIGLRYFFLGQSEKMVMMGAAAPTTGTYVRGDRVLNDTPSAGGYAGWICVTGGSPGTWKGFGIIEA